MKTDALTDFSVDRETKTITVQREYAAPLPWVWDAYTNSEMLDQWWAPKPWKSRTKSMNFTEGGKWLYAMVGPNGEEHWSVAKYEKIDDQKTFTVTDGFTDENGNIKTDMPQSKWTMQFSPGEKGTLVKFTITFDALNDLEEILKMGFREGLLSAMENLDAIFADNNQSL